MTSSWGANTAISLGTVVQATTKQYSGLHFKCTTAGTTAATEPDWPTKLGDTIIAVSYTHLTLPTKA